MNAQEFHYRIGWRSANARPGAHPGRQSGNGLLFERHAAFIDHPDPRRLDIRATLLDPRQEYRVRVYQQRSSIDIFALVDLSASMGYRAGTSKMEAVADFIDSLTFSAHRNGDTLSIGGYAESEDPVIFVPSTRQIGPLRSAAASLRAWRPVGGNAEGLLQAAHRLPHRRCLVFLLSDFHYSIALLERIMTALARHDVVAVVVWHDVEQTPPEHGLAKMRDMESGSESLLWLRPELLTKLKRTFDERRNQLSNILNRFGRTPLFLNGAFSSDAVTRYFYTSL